MGEDKRAVLPHRVPHAGGPKIPHGSRLPSEPAHQPSPGPGAAALLAQLRSAAGAPVSRGADAPGGRGADAPVSREAGAAGRPPRASDPRRLSPPPPAPPPPP